MNLKIEVEVSLETIRNICGEVASSASPAHRSLLKSVVTIAEQMQGAFNKTTNYVADDDTYPHVVWFANGRKVSFASGGHLLIEHELNPCFGEP